MRLRATIEGVEGGWIVETEYDSGEPRRVIYTDYVSAIRAVATVVGYLNNITILPPSVSAGEKP